MTESPRADVLKPGFSFGVHCEVMIQKYKNVILSVPAVARGDELGEKDLLTTGVSGADGKYTLEEHLRFLVDSGAIRSDVPLLVLGLRNNLVNLRAPIIHRGISHAVQGEEPERSRRPYYGIALREQGGRLTMEQALGGAEHPERWAEFFCAGIPVLWDDRRGEALLDAMLIEAADHSHIYDLPRGAHPSATDESRAAWQRLHNTFVQELHADAATAVKAMRKVVEAMNPPLRRCEDYLHAVLGVTEVGGLFCLFAHGRLEDLGEIAALRGCQRAVCVENSGSVMPTLLKQGVQGESLPLLRAPNFRPKGRALMVVVLEEASFESQPVLAVRS